MHSDEPSHTFSSKFHIPSSWNPPPGSASDAIEDYIVHTRKLLKSVLSFPSSSPPLRRSNLPLHSRNFVRLLSRNPSIIVKPADKNLGLVALDRSKYNAEAERQLGDSTTYSPQPSLQNERDRITLVRSIWNRLQRLFSTHRSAAALDEIDYSFVMKKLPPLQVKFPRFYLLPKVHKPKFTGRPLLPSMHWVTTPASILIDHYLQPLVATLPWVLPDSKTLVNHLASVRIPADTQITLSTSDINSLFTNIPQDAGLSAVQSFMAEHTHLLSPARATLIHVALTIVMKNNYFEFNGAYYQQMKGAAMGTPCSVVFANIFVYMRERTLVSASLADRSLLMYARFLDDIFMVHIGTAAAPFLSHLERPCLDIALESHTSSSSADFLDLHITLSSERTVCERTLLTSVHQKQLNAYLYIPNNSFHPPQAKGAFIITELQRYVRNSSLPADYLRLAHAFYARLRARGYPPRFLRLFFNRVTYNNRAALLLPRSARPPRLKTAAFTPQQHRMFFTTEYTPLLKRIALGRILTTHRPQPSLFAPMLSLRRSPNLGSILCVNRSLPPTVNAAAAPMPLATQTIAARPISSSAAFPPPNARN
jgi:hypothetical protein